MGGGSFSFFAAMVPPLLVFSSLIVESLSWSSMTVLYVSNRFSGVMVNTVLSYLPPLRNEKGSFFGIDMVGDPSRYAYFCR